MDLFDLFLVGVKAAVVAIAAAFGLGAWIF